jgi:hypothetical protein
MPNRRAIAYSRGILTRIRSTVRYRGRRRHGPAEGEGSHSREVLRPYTTRLQKGGALVSDMRRILLEWNGTPDCGERIVRTNVLSSPSRYRALDVVTRTFMPRFVDSDPPRLWRPVRLLEQAGWSQAALLPIHYYAAAAAEPLLWDFVVEILAERHAKGHQEVHVTDVLRFLDRSQDARFQVKRWSKEVSIRVARGLLASLRDFGVLAGAVKKRISPLYLPLESFAFVARIRYELGIRGHSALQDRCWQLYFLAETSVERLFLEAHQEKLLTYLAAGSVIRLEFPGTSLEDYARELTQRAH